MHVLSYFPQREKLSRFGVRWEASLHRGPTTQGAACSSCLLTTSNAVRHSIVQRPDLRLTTSPMSESYSAQPLATSHADLITCLSFSASVPSLLASTSLDGWIRIHARSAAATVTGEGSNNDGRLMGSNGQRGGHPDADEGGDDTVDDVDGEEQDDWVEVGAVKANDGPVWKAIWGPREYGRSLLVSIAGSVVHVWGESSGEGVLCDVMRCDGRCRPLYSGCRAPLTYHTSFCGRPILSYT